MLKQRIITSLVLGSLTVIGILYLPLIYFKMLVALVISLGVWEFSELFWPNNYKKKLNFLAIFLLICLLTQFFPARPILIIGALWWLIAPYFLWKNMKITWLVGILIFVPCFVGLVELQEKFGAKHLLYLIAIVCAADIGAYFTGRFCGKHLLAPKISPKKTIEGLFGGLLLSLVVAIALGMRSTPFLILVIITSLWSVIGDLFESLLKRQAGVKDSGKLLPGQGGMYDRLDSLTAAVPFFVLGVKICFN